MSKQAFIYTCDNVWRELAHDYDVPADLLDTRFGYQNHQGYEDCGLGYFSYNGIWYHTDMFWPLVAGNPGQQWYGWCGMRHGEPDANGVAWAQIYLGKFERSDVAIRLCHAGQTYQVATYAVKGAV